MVGMLAENRMEQRFDGGYAENSTTRFESVPSISVSFAVKKNPLGVLRVVPKGLLFYTVEPDYDKTVAFLIQKYSEKDNVRCRPLATGTTVFGMFLKTRKKVSLLRSEIIGVMKLELLPEWARHRFLEITMQDGKPD